MFKAERSQKQPIKCIHVHFSQLGINKSRLPVDMSLCPRMSVYEGLTVGDVESICGAYVPLPGHTSSLLIFTKKWSSKFFKTNSASVSDRVKPRLVSMFPTHSRASFPAQLPGLNFSRPLLFFTEEWLCNIRLSHTRLSTNQTAQTLPCNRYQATRPALVHQHTEASILLKPSAAHIMSPVETSSLAGESVRILRRL